MTCLHFLALRASARDETDLPSSDHTDIGALDIVASLKRALDGLSEARGYSVQSEVMANAAGVFGV